MFVSGPGAFSPFVQFVKAYMNMAHLKQVENATLGAFTPKEHFHSSYNYRTKYLLFGVFTLQEYTGTDFSFRNAFWGEYIGSYSIVGSNPLSLKFKSLFRDSLQV